MFKMLNSCKGTTITNYIVFNDYRSISKDHELITEYHNEKKKKSIEVSHYDKCGLKLRHMT